jgi:hypothetical protein
LKPGQRICLNFGPQDLGADGKKHFTISYCTIIKGKKIPRYEQSCDFIFDRDTYTVQVSSSYTILVEGLKERGRESFLRSRRIGFCNTQRVRSQCQSPLCCGVGPKGSRVKTPDPFSLLRPNSNDHRRKASLALSTWTIGDPPIWRRLVGDTSGAPAGSRFLHSLRSRPASLCYPNRQRSHTPGVLDKSRASVRSLGCPEPAEERWSSAYFPPMGLSRMSRPL